MKRRTYVLWKKILLCVLSACSLSGLLYVYFGTQACTITSYELVGVPELYVNTIQGKLHELEKEKRFKIVPTNKILSYQGLRIKAYITYILPNTASVTMRPVSLHTLRVTVTPYTPLFRLDEKSAITREGYSYIDINSLDAYPRLTIASSSMSTTTLDGILYTSIIIPQASSTYEVLSELERLVPKINSVLFPVTYIVVDSYGDMFLSNASSTSSINVPAHLDVDKVWSTVISAIDTEPLKTLLATKKNELEYIDVRYGNKVFYKFTNTTIPTIINASSTNNHATEATTTLR